MALRKTPSTTSIPAARRRSNPRPSTRGFGSPAATIARTMPASTIALVHGGVRPDVIAGFEGAVDRRAAGQRRRRHPAREPRRGASPDLRAIPHPRRGRRERRRHRPWGSGRRGRVRAPRAPARAACGARGLDRGPRLASSSSSLPSGRGSGVRGARLRAHGGTATPSPPIPTFTVGPGISPGPPSRGSRGVADCHRRWGIAPRPGNELISRRSIRATAVRRSRRATAVRQGARRSIA